LRVSGPLWPESADCDDLFGIRADESEVLRRPEPRGPPILEHMFEDRC
jgi:hypothetical protein